MDSDESLLHPLDQGTRVFAVAVAPSLDSKQSKIT